MELRVLAGLPPVVLNSIVLMLSAGRKWRKCLGMGESLDLHLVFSFFNLEKKPY